MDVHIITLLFIKLDKKSFLHYTELYKISMKQYFYNNDLSIIILYQKVSFFSLNNSMITELQIHLTPTCQYNTLWLSLTNRMPTKNSIPFNCSIKLCIMYTLSVCLYQSELVLDDQTLDDHQKLPFIFYMFFIAMSYTIYYLWQPKLQKHQNKSKTSLIGI